MSPEEALIVSDIREQFRSMYAAELPVVYGFLFVRVAGNKALAEDLTAETFTAAMGEYRAGRPEIVTESWLRTVAKRRLIDHWRHQRVVDANEVDVAGQNRPQPINVGDRELIVESLAKLSEDEQRALVLQHVEGKLLPAFCAEGDRPHAPYLAHGGRWRQLLGSAQEIAHEHAGPVLAGFAVHEHGPVVSERISDKIESSRQGVSADVDVSGQRRRRV